MAPATVNEEANKAAKSTSRRAHAANLVPDLGRHDSAPTKLWRRAFALANALTDYDLDGEAGQEPFSVIHYNGSVAGAGPPEGIVCRCRSRAARPREEPAVLFGPARPPAVGPSGWAGGC